MARAFFDFRLKAKLHNKRTLPPERLFRLKAEATATVQCAATAARPRGRRISSTSGSRSRKMMPSIRNR